MEISIGDYGRHLFEQMTNKKNGLSHWDSIRAEAKPLVEKLLELNQKMEGGGYQIIGIKDKSGKKVLSQAARIKKAQMQWECEAGTLKEGDRIWLHDNYDHEMYIGQNDPVEVMDITKKGIYLEMNGFNCEYVQQISVDEKVLKAPADFLDKEDEYTSDEYWLEQADKMGI